MTTNTDDSKTLDATVAMEDFIEKCVKSKVLTQELQREAIMILPELSGLLKYKTKITYFKASGKFYTEAYFYTITNLHWEIVNLVKKAQSEFKLPGLTSGIWEGPILIEPLDEQGECNVPHMIPPKYSKKREEK